MGGFFLQRQQAELAELGKEQEQADLIEQQAAQIQQMQQQQLRRRQQQEQQQKRQMSAAADVYQPVSLITRGITMSDNRVCVCVCVCVWCVLRVNLLAGCRAADVPVAPVSAINDIGRAAAEYLYTGGVRLSE